LRSAGNTVKVAKYKKVGWLQHGETLVGLMRVFIVMAQEGFHMHETVRFLGEGVILTGSNLDPMYRSCEGVSGYSDCIQTKSFIGVMIMFFQNGLR